MKYIIANWKAHFTSDDATNWCNKFSEKLSNGNKLQASLAENKVCIIIAPPFPLIPIVKQSLPQTKNIYIAAQDVSRYDGGNYTGEVAANTLAGLVRYVIIGHSERRSWYNESEDDIAAKIMNASKHVIQPIQCIRGINDKVHELSQYIAYEPVEAIGTGKNASAQLVLQVKDALGIKQPKVFIYGGSVNPDTCAEYLQHPDIDGLLIGTASLDPDAFYSISTQA
ncbi:MAG: hypothetical protein RI947_382 [Candidatus Parcubacteria bacterium]|jgi:triosephosphate isomerase